MANAENKIYQKLKKTDDSTTHFFKSVICGPSIVFLLDRSIFIYFYSFIKY